MKYVMKQTWFSLGDDLVIGDERGRDAYRIDGASFAFGRNLTFYDRRDSELAYVSRKTTSSGKTTYEIYHGDDLQAVIRRDAVAMPRCRFSVETPCPDDLHAEGDLAGREYTFTREGKPVGRVSKQFFHARDTYGVDVGRGEDDLLLLASAMVIDLCFHAGKAAMPRKLACSR